MIEVKEQDNIVVNNGEPIHWILLTSHKIASFEDAYQIIQWYIYLEMVYRTAF